MSSDNESDLDNVMEDILKDFDDVTKSDQPRKNPTMTSSIKGIPVKFGSFENGSLGSNKSSDIKGNQGKSVRFHDEGDTQSDSMFKKLSPSSNLINTMFFAGDEKNEPPSVDLVDNNLAKGPRSTAVGSSNISAKTTNNDWLGISKDETSQPKKSSQSGHRDVFLSDHDFGLSFDTAENTSKPFPITTSKQELENKPLPTPTPTKQPEPMLSRKPTSIPQTASLDSWERENRSTPTPTNIYSKIPPTTGPSSLDMQELRNQPNTSPKTSSFLDSLPFLLGKQQQQSSSGVGESRPPDLKGGSTGTDVNLEPGQTATKTMKKKTVGKSSISGPVGGGGGVTLQLPTHLVNEDELKAMSSSLKTLYANQLELQEQSYREQLDFFAAQSKRKEELLKDELVRMGEDYELRIQKLKAELENSNFPKFNQELAHISSKLEKVSSKLELITPSPNNEADLIKLLHQEMTKEIQTPMLKALSLFETNLTARLDNIGNSDAKNGVMQDIISEIVSKLDEISSNNQKSSQNIINSHTNLKSSLVDSIVGPISNVLDQSRAQDLRKKDKSNLAMKELRKDVRRLYSELDGKHDLVHRSQLNLELEQRSITQSVRDINTFLKVINESGSHYQNHNNHHDSSSHLATTMQAVQANVQNEMEIKLLREERKSLSESIAQVNVERRKLADEKIGLERDKMEFEREKGRVRDIEAKSNARLMEAQDLQRQAEQMRHKESVLVADAEAKLHNLSKEKIKLKQRLFEMEQALQLKEQKLYLEKSELIREKEFGERLRDEGLCAGCLKRIKGGDHVPLLPLPTSLNRSSGDGLELDFNTAATSNMLSKVLTPNEKAFYFLHENKYL